ncbi:MAG: autotransporter outer membrane beta-barrel domain-containing protein, partial [Sutterella sp.]|nr:autotransporter outer membrane beta-barrel domain-containing protein [Sutterella sp.]
MAAGKTSSASGLIAENDGTITLKEKAEITNISARGTDYSYAAGIEANGGSITLERGVVISNVSAEDAFAIDAYNNGKVIINKSESQNQVHIDQDLAVATRSTITANFMSADSVFNGRTLWKPADAGEDPLSSRINLKFSNKATWNVPGNNTLFGTLMLDGGIVNLQPCIPLDNPQAVNLNVYELKGPGGTVGIRVDSERNITDRLHVGKGAGDHLVKILPTGTEATQESLDWLIKQDEGNARFTLVDEKVDFGLYQYELASKTNEDDLQSTSWYLTPSSNDDPDDSPPGPEYSQSGKTVLALASLGAQTTQHLNSLSDLRKRLGEVRHDTDAGLWVKVSGQKDRFTGFEGFGFTQKSWRVSLGADFMVDKWLIGANFKYADSSQKVKTDIRTKGDSHSEGMNLYATYLAENGAYADFVLSADRNCQKLSTAMSDGTPVSGKYDNIGYGASLEVGTQWTVSEMHNLFVEPQAQLAYYKARGKDFTLTNDMKVFQGDFESLTGRVGAVVGK